MAKKPNAAAVDAPLLQQILPNFQVSSFVLMKELKKVKSIIAANPILPVLENFLFQVYHERLKITGSDLQQVMFTDIEVISKASFSICVPAQILIDTLDLIQDQFITFSVDTRSYQAQIQAIEGTYRVSGESAEDFPKLIEKRNSDRVIFHSNQLLHVLDSVDYCIGKDELRPALTGAYFKIGPEGATVVGCDMHRLSLVQLHRITLEDERKMIVPGKAIDILRKLLPKDETVRMDIDASNVFFEFGKFTLITRLIDEVYPDYTNAVPKESQTLATISRMEVINCLKRVVNFADWTQWEIRLQFTPRLAHVSDNLIITAENYDYNYDAKETLLLDSMVGPYILIACNGKRLLEALSNLEGEFIRFELGDESRAIIIESVNQRETMHQFALVMPIQMNNVM